MDNNLSVVQILMGLKAEGIRTINYLKEEEKPQPQLPKKP